MIFPLALPAHATACRRFVSFRPTAALVALAFAVVAPGLMPAATQLHFVGEIGLYDAEHTTPGGGRRSEFFHALPEGVLAGSTERYLEDGSGISGPRGWSTWLATPWGRTVRVGFWGTGTGPESSSIYAVNAAGQALGRTINLPGGPRSWIASIEHGTVALDYFAGENVYLVDLNDEGWFIGHRWGNPVSVASLAHGNNAPVRIGLFDAAHTAPSGRQATTPVALNNAGYVIGYSSRFVDVSEDEPYQTGWLRRPDGTYLTFGTTGPVMALPEQLTESGYFGLRLYNRDTQTTTLQIGHVGGTVRTVGSGQVLEFLTESGAAISYVAEYYRGSPLWRRSFLNTAAGGTVPLGLPDYLGTNPRDGTDTVTGINASGMSAGYSRGPSSGSKTAGWVADADGNVTRIGLFSGQYEWGTPAAPAHYSEVHGINDAGWVWGSSNRYYDSATSRGGGNTAWVYNVGTGEYTTFELLVRSLDNYADSRVDRVLENGTAIGTYLDFGPDEGDIIERVFLWVPGEGVILFDDRIDVSAEDAGFARYRAPTRPLGGGAVAGTAVPDGYVQFAQALYIVQITDGSPPPPPPPPGEIEHVGRLGFYDARHTHASGFRSSALIDAAASGYAVGTSALFVGADDVTAAPGRVAQTAWLGDITGATRRVGFYDALHTRDDGRQENTPLAVNDGGVSIGTATRFQGHAYAGESAWVSDRHGTVLKLGYYDAAHTAANGAKLSRPVALNARNQVIGYSLNPDTLAASAWLATSTGVMTALGLTDAAHTAPDGTRVSLPVGLNDLGYVVGNSEFYVPGVTAAGSTAWLRSPSGIMRNVGFETGGHRAANGLHESRVDFLSANVRVVGHSTRYGAGSSTRVGQTAWLTYPGEPNRPIGFYTGLHAGANNVAFSRVLGLNESGYAMGYSAQFPVGATTETAARGRTAWLATLSTGAVVVGLYGPQHSTGPFQTNAIRGQNRSDAAIGTAVRYASGQDRGLDAWFASLTGGTIPLGLRDARHIRADGYVRHVPNLVTDSRRVAGTSARFAGSLEIGKTAWIYDVATGDYAPLVLSVRPSDQFAWSLVTVLREDGSALGLYRKFASNGASLGDRAFLYLPGQGAFDLGSLLEADPTTFGWALLGRPDATTLTGHLFGTGTLAGYGPGLPPRQFAQGVYLLRE